MAKKFIILPLDGGLGTAYVDPEKVDYVKHDKYEKVTIGINGQEICVDEDADFIVNMCSGKYDDTDNVTE